MQKLPIPAKLNGSLPFLIKAGLVGTDPSDETLRTLARIIEAIGDRLKTFGDIIQYADFFFMADDAVVYNTADLNKRLTGKPSAFSILRGFGKYIADRPDFSRDTIRHTLHEFIPNQLSNPSRALGAEVDRLLVHHLIDQQEHFFDYQGLDLTGLEAETKKFIDQAQIQIGDIIHALRVALTGKSVGPGLYDCMLLLGKASCLRRIDRALELDPQLTKIKHDFDQLPWALTGPYDDLDVNESIELQRGGFVLGFGATKCEVSGSMKFEWMPRPGIKCHFVGPIPFGSIPETVTVSREVDSLAFPALPTSLTFSSSDESKMDATPVGTVTTGSLSKAATIRFYLSNFHSYFGNHIKRKTDKGLSATVGRTSFGIGDYVVTLDAMHNARNRVQSAKEKRGFALSHIGSIARNSTTGFDAQSVDDLCATLFYMFSFLRGIWVSPLLLAGRDTSGAEVWHEWAPRIASACQNVWSWFPRETTCIIPRFAPGFAAIWQDNEMQRTVQSSIYWYLQANTMTAVDAGMVISEMALEHASRAALQRPGGQTSSTLDSNPKGSELCELALAEAGVELEIPAALADLKAVANHLGESKGPRVLHRILAAVRHGERLGSTDERRFPIYEAMMLSQWYAELLLLRAFNYSGFVSSRVARGDIMPVPWSAKTI